MNHDSGYLLPPIWKTDLLRSSINLSHDLIERAIDPLLFYNMSRQLQFLRRHSFVSGVVETLIYRSLSICPEEIPSKISHSGRRNFTTDFVRENLPTHYGATFPLRAVCTMSKTIIKCILA